MSDFSLTATARAAATAEILRASGASNATDVKGVGVWRALACDALERPAAWTSEIDARLADGDHRRMARESRPCGAAAADARRPAVRPSAGVPRAEGRQRRVQRSAVQVHLVRIPCARACAQPRMDRRGVRNPG